MNARRILDAALLAVAAYGAAAATGCFVRAGRVLLMQQSLFRHMERTEQEKDETIPRRADLAHADGRHTSASDYTTTASGTKCVGLGTRQEGPSTWSGGLETHGEGEKDPISQGIENIMRFGVDRDTKGNNVW